METLRDGPPQASRNASDTDKGGPGYLSDTSAHFKRATRGIYPSRLRPCLDVSRRHPDRLRVLSCPRPLTPVCRFPTTSSRRTPSDPNQLHFARNLESRWESDRWR